MTTKKTTKKTPLKKKATHTKSKTPLQQLEPLVISEIIVPLLVSGIREGNYSTLDEVFEDFRLATGASYSDEILDRYLEDADIIVATRIFIEGEEYNDPNQGHVFNSEEKELVVDRDVGGLLEAAGISVPPEEEEEIGIIQGSRPAPSSRTVAASGTVLPGPPSANVFTQPPRR